MPSLDAVISAIRTALDRTAQMASRIARATAQAAEVRDRLRALGVENGADRLSVATDALEAGQAQVAAIAERLRSALSAAELARSGSGDGAGLPPRPGAPPPEPGRSKPDFARAAFDDRKLTQYALNPDHPVGGNKARVIKSRTGLSAGDALEVKRQILEKAPLGVAVPHKVDEHGARWLVDLDLSGPAGTMKVRTAWITDDSGTRLVTISFPPKEER